MALSVGDFTAKVGDGGSLKLQVEGKKTTVTNFANTFKGKVAAFFRGIFKPGTVATENRNVLNAFVSSIRSDPGFGDSFANIASTTLARDIQGGKPLTTRKVQNVMDQLQAAKRQNIGFTRFQALIVAENDDSRAGAFGSMFADIAADKGMSVLLCDYDTKALSREITDAVMQRGQNGLGIVTKEQAQEIAKAKITEFLDGVIMRNNYQGAQTLVDKFQQMAPSESVSAPETRVMLENAARERGLPTDLSQYDFSKLGDKVNNSIMTACASGKNNVSEQDARSMTQKLVNDFMDAKAQLFKHVDQETSNVHDAAKMKAILLLNPGKVDGAQYVKSIATLRTQMSAMLDAFAKSNPGRVEIYQSVKTFRASMEQEAAKAMGTNFGGPELKAFINDALQYTLDTGFGDDDKLGQVVAGLGSSGCKELKGVMEFALYEPSMGKHDASLKSYWQMNTITARIGEALETKLGLDNEAMQKIMVPAQVADAASIPGDLREAMENDGFVLPT